jgi:selenocysteine lyase/cysteine desulfurase
MDLPPTDADFPGARGYLNTASIGLPPAAAVDALRAALDEWVAGVATAPGYDPVVARCRDAWARIHAVDAAHVAIGPQVSYFTGLVAASLPRGAEVVAYDGDFASLLYPFLARGDLRVRWAPLERVADAVEPATALVAVSAVQSADGRVADLDAIAGAAGAHGAMTLVDATQASGWLPLRADRFDFLVAGTYKWLLSPRGTACMAVRPDRLEALAPLAPGWYSADDPWGAIYGPPLRLAADARRLDMSPAWHAWVGTLPALEYIDAVGVDAIHAHDLRLANRVREGIGMPPGDSAVVAVDRPEAADALAAAGIRASVPGDFLRLCFHLYNSDDDVDAVLKELAGAG